MQDLDQNDLRYVLSLSRTGRIAAAARKLGVDYSTFSRRIARIESQMGVRLFERHAGILKPTDRGKTIVRRAEIIEVDVNAVDGCVTSVGQPSEHPRWWPALPRS